MPWNGMVMSWLSPTECRVSVGMAVHLGNEPEAGPRAARRRRRPCARLRTRRRGDGQSAPRRPRAQGCPHRWCGRSRRPNPRAARARALACSAARLGATTAPATSSLPTRPRREWREWSEGSSRHSRAGGQVQGDLAEHVGQGVSLGVTGTGTGPVGLTAPVRVRATVFAVGQPIPWRADQPVGMEDRARDTGNLPVSRESFIRTRNGPCRRHGAITCQLGGDRDRLTSHGVDGVGVQDERGRVVPDAQLGRRAAQAVTEGNSASRRR